MKYIYNLSVILSLIFLVSFFTFCDNSANDESLNEDSIVLEAEKTNEDSTVNNDTEETIDQDAQFIPPSPLQIASIFNKSGMDFIYELPHSPDLVNNYTSKFLQSIIFGVYSSDLAYCIVNDKYDEAMTKEYLKQAGVMDTKYKCEGLSDCGCNEGFTSGTVLDPFFGAGTTGLVALKQNKKFIGIELNPEYIEIAKKRLKPYLEQTKLK